MMMSGTKFSMMQLKEQQVLHSEPSILQLSYFVILWTVEVYLITTGKNGMITSSMILRRKNSLSPLSSTEPWTALNSRSVSLQVDLISHRLI